MSTLSARPLFSGEILIFLLNQKYAGVADLATRNYECEPTKQSTFSQANQIKDELAVIPNTMNTFLVNCIFSMYTDDKYLTILN